MELHRELEGLPELEAPSTLIPGVLARIKKPAIAPWYHSSWWQWPLALRGASMVVAFAVLGALGWLSGTFGELGLGQQLLHALVEFKAVMTLTLHTAETALGSSAVFWREHGRIILIAAASLLLATYLTCVAAGTALYQLAWRRSL
jgi:hypothetical protein